MTELKTCEQSEYWKQKRKGRPRKMLHVVEDGKLVLLQFSTEAEAITAWNRREGEK